MPRYKVDPDNNIKRIPVDEDDGSQSPEQPEVDDTAESDEDVSVETDTPEPEVDDEGIEVGEKPVSEKQLKKRLARERRKMQKELREAFGTSDLSEAKSYYEAGRAVTNRAGTTPDEVVSRLNQRNQQQPQQQQPQQSRQSGNRPYRRRSATFGGRNNQQQQPSDPSQDMLQEIQEMKNLLLSEREEKARTQQEQEARQEFGDLYEEYEFEIEDYAEDHGLSLADAAAVVLRPHLKDLYQQQARKRKQVERRRQVDDSGGSPGGKETVNYRSKLSAEARRIAEQTGIGYKKMYEKRVASGKIEE